MRYEQKAELQDSNKARIYEARMYEEKKKQNKWDKLETQIWRVVLFKEDNKGNQKFYEYDGDHSSIAEQMYDVENEYLNEIEENKK